MTLALLLALRAALPLVPPEPSLAPAIPSIGRVYTSDAVHVGVRPHMSIGVTHVAAAVTLQITF